MCYDRCMRQKLEPCKDGGVNMAKRKLFRWILALCWLALTVFLSQQSGSQSAAVSGWFTKAVTRLFGFFGINASYATLHYAMRKLAHFCVHFILAILIYRAFIITNEYQKNAILLTLFTCMVVAFFDEGIQSVAPGRAMMVGDLILNLFGVTSGTIAGILTVKQK